MCSAASIIHRLALVAVVMMLLIPISGRVFAEEAPSSPLDTTALERDLDILPTLKGHMARLGSLMNILFRDVSNPDQQTRVLDTITEMTFLLNRVGKKFEPRNVSYISDSEAKKVALAGFHQCIDGAVGLLRDMAHEVGDENYAQAKEKLFKLDGLRRQCHSRYTGES